MFGKPGWAAAMVMGMIVVVLVVQALEALLFLRGLRITGRWMVAVVVMFVAANLVLPYVVWLIVGARQPSTLLAQWLVRPAFAWFFNWLCFMLFLAPLVWLARFGESWFGMVMVYKTVRIVVLVLVLAGSLLSLVGLVNNRRPPLISRVEVHIKGLDPALSGLTIAHLSDLHVAWWDSREEVNRIGELTAALHPDLLVITGDMVDHHPDYVYTMADALEPVQPRLGRFAVIGNHDVYTGREAVADRMEERGYRMLRSDCVSLQDRGAPLNLAGYDDSGKSWTSGDPAANKIPAANAACDPALPIILLTHRPPRFQKILDSPVALALAGHTHGGQFRLPFGGPGLADFTFEHADGLYTQDGKSLYISRGTGTVGWPFRLFCPAEISLIVLRPE